MSNNTGIRKGELLKINWDQVDFEAKLIRLYSCRTKNGRPRFVPIMAGTRDQLWAEAKVRFESGCPWWLDTPDLVQRASDHQAARYEGDPWEEVIGPWLENRQSTAISEVLEKCLSKPQAQWTQTDKIRAARCLRAQGWLRYRERQGDRLEWRYRKVG